MRLEVEKPEIKLLKQMQNDLSFLKQKVVVIEDEIDAISEDLHEVRPEYIENLQKIEKEGRFHSFKNIEELRKAIEVSG